MSNAEPCLPWPQRLFPWLLLAAGLFYAALLPRLCVGYFNDDAEFLLLGRSLLDGRYATLWAPGQPPETLLMPGFPLLLAPFVWLWAPHWAWFKLIPLALSLLSGFLFWRLLACWLDPGARLAALALFLFNPVVAGLSGAVMSDVSLLFAALLVFCLLQRLCAGDEMPSWGLGLLLGGASIVRPVAALLIPAAALALTLARGRRAALRALLPAAAVWAAVLLRNLLAAHELSRYTAFWREGLSVLAAGPAAVLDNWHRVAFLFCGPGLTGLRLSREGWGIPASLAVIAGAATLAAVGFAVLLRERAQRPLLWAVAVFVAGCLLVQAFWPVLDTRYFLPLLPFGLAALVTGGRALCQRLPWPRLGLAAGLTVLLGAYAVQDARLWASARSGGRPQGHVFPAETLAWIARNTPENALFLTKAPWLYLYAGRRGLPAILADDSEEYRYHCLRRGVTHVLSLPFSILTIPGGRTLDQARNWNRNMAWAASWTEAFAPAYANLGEGTVVYRVVPDPAFSAAYALSLAAREAFARGEIGAGLGALDRALRLRPRLVSALNAKGAALMLCGRPQEAERSLRRALAVRPDHALALTNLARLQARQGRKEEARRLYARARAAIERTGEFGVLRPALDREAAALR